MLSGKASKTTQKKQYKIDIYKKDELTVICTNEKKDSGNIDIALERKLKTYKNKFMGVSS